MREVAVSIYITFSCDTTDPVGHPALTTNATVTIQPTITGFVAPYTVLGLYRADGAITTGNCSLRTDFQSIFTGDPDTFPVGNWNYCARYHNADGDLQPFTVDWEAV